MPDTNILSSPAEAARRIAASLPDRALAVESARGVPADLLAELRAARLFDLMAPASVGGHEAEPATLIGVVEELSRADASTGWTVMVGQGSGYLAWLSADAAATLVGDGPLPLIVGSMAPHGTAHPVDEGVMRLSGRWPYASGSAIADYLIAPYRDVSGPARFALVPAAQAVVHDTWHSAGLRGSGSHDFELAEAEVPVELTFDPFGPARESGPLYRLPYMTYLLTAMAGFPLGAARRIVTEFRDIVRLKRNTERVLLADTPIVQAEIARCEAVTASARSYVYDTIGEVWAQTLDGEPSPAARARFTGAVQHAMRAALDVADSAMRACGASQLYDRAPLQRFFRDVQAAAQHIAFGLDAQRRVGSVLLDRDVPRPLI